MRAVVAGLASTNVETYGLALDRSVTLMLWGHGRNYTAKNHKADGAVESWLQSRSAHVFAYTQSGKTHLVEQGVAAEDITVVQNSTDTKKLLGHVQELQGDTEHSVRQQYSLDGASVGLFVGAFDEPKKLPLLFEAADLINASRPDFVLLIAGAGPDEDFVTRMAAARPYVRLIGRADGEALARLSTVVDVVMIPGRVGLVAVDALALGLPIATTTYPLHAPEADYLTPGVDSLWTDMTAEAYSAGVLELLRDREHLSRLASAAWRHGQNFSVEQSAERFVAGVIAGLGRG